jgi:acetyltransferase-like isoleucine patch superfamily enzyme
MQGVRGSNPLSSTPGQRPSPPSTVRESRRSRSRYAATASARPIRSSSEAAKPISVGDNVWLGGGVIVCSGVSIGENTVVGAGAVVVRGLPANVIAVGNPARVIRSL